MTCIINAVSGTGITQTADGSGQVKLQANGVTTNALAWVNYNSSTQAIASSYNVSSVTYSSTGRFIVNFTNALSSNYAPIGTTSGGNCALSVDTATYTTSACAFYAWYPTNNATNNTLNAVAFFGT